MKWKFVFRIVEHRFFFIVISFVFISCHCDDLCLQSARPKRIYERENKRSSDLFASYGISNRFYFIVEACYAFVFLMFEPHFDKKKTPKNSTFFGTFCVACEQSTLTQKILWRKREQKNERKVENWNAFERVSRTNVVTFNPSWYIININWYGIVCATSKRHWMNDPTHYNLFIYLCVYSFLSPSFAHSVCLSPRKCRINVFSNEKILLFCALNTVYFSTSRRSSLFQP